MNEKIVDSFLLNGLFYFSRHKRDGDKVYGPYWYSQPVEGDSTKRHPQTYIGKNLPQEVIEGRAEVEAIANAVGLLKTKLQSSLDLIKQFEKLQNVSEVELMTSMVSRYIGDIYLPKGDK